MRQIENYISAWNAKTSEERHNLLVSCIATDAVYLDPHVSDVIHGIEGIQTLMELFRERFDHQLQSEGKIDAHHNVFRLRWRLQRDNGEMLSCGLMVGELSYTGTIERIIHFIDDF